MAMTRRSWTMVRVVGPLQERRSWGTPVRPARSRTIRKEGTTGVDVVTIFARAIVEESRKECVNAGERLWTFGNGEEVHAIRVRVTGKTAWKVWYPKTSNNAATRV
jgi:hypothetical protein